MLNKGYGFADVERWVPAAADTVFPIGSVTKQFTAAATLLLAEEGKQDAEIPFDWLLRDVTSKRGPYEFVLSEPARCPNCRREITEKTLVEPRAN